MRSSRRCGPGIRGITCALTPRATRRSWDDCRARLDRLAREEDKLKTQLDNAHDLVEQGIYTPAVFRERSEKLAVCA